MSDELYRLLYCSRNLIPGQQADRDTEISQILATARTNNSRQNITGALLFNTDYFEQVLEGPRTAVERTFEQIQRDARHSDVTVLNSEGVLQRDFPEWSMAHVQPPSGQQAAGVSAALDYALLNPSASSSEVLTLLRSLVIQED